MNHSHDTSQGRARSRYQIPRTPDNEADRLEALKRYNILDTLPDPAINDLSLIAAQICDTPIALVSLVDGERQWFKAKCGLGATETSRDASFCAHAILQPDDVFIIPDTWEDERFADNPLVMGEPHIRFYAGTPLVTEDGYALGSLCVIDRSPRTLSSAQISALEALGRQVIDQFEAHRTLRRFKQTIVELHKTRVSAVHNAKMSALGYLVSGIAHEVNNPIGFIGSNLPHVRDYAEELLDALALYRQACPQPPEAIAARLADIEVDYVSEDFSRVLESMQSGVDRVVKIIQSLKTFARNDEAEIKAIDLNTNLDHLLMLFEQKLAATATRPAITLTRDYGDDLPPLLCLPAELNQVVLSLLTNAISAIESKTASTAHPAQHKGQISLRTYVQDDQLVLRLTDNGSGIAPEHVEHIFEPFFTTNPVGGGVGLGLASCYAIITEQHNGTIAYHPNPTGGSTFEIALPVADPDPAPSIQHN